MSNRKRTRTTKRQIQAGRDVNIVELGANSTAAQVAAGEMVKQKQPRLSAQDTRDLAIASQAMRAAANELEQNVDASLTAEIKSLRQYTKEVARFIKDTEPARAPALLNALSLATTRVANLLKAQKELTGRSGGLVELLQQALREVLEEKRAQG